ncbi:hypothetical protein PI124_g10042 [Phytophthora idaei]|nr:hypothetical protein PI124_g10042 [Phytophthora idaei]
MEGNLGILYVCGEQTDGKITVVDSLLGRKVRGICGGYDRFVALVDAWELEWTVSNEIYLESQLVQEGLQDVKVHHVAFGKNHNVALSLDGQLFSWGRSGTKLECSELGYQYGLSNVHNYRVKTPGPESDDTTTTGIPRRVVTALELFFTQVSCDGRLLRGTLGTFCESTGDVVCQVPKFRLTGEYAVEVSMNGKHFTSNGRVFTVFKRPHVAAVSVFDTRFAGGEELTLSLCGSLPEICRRPVVRFLRCCIDGGSGQLVPMNYVESSVSVGGFDERSENVDEEETEQDPSDVTGRLLRFTIPVLPTNGEGITPFTLEISYDGGLMFTPVCVDPALERPKDEEDEDDEENYSHSRKHEEPGPTEPHIIWAHDAQLVRVSPNSFLANDLPQKITLEVPNLLPPEVAKLLATIVHSPPSENDETKTVNATATLTIDRVEGNFVTCTIPRLMEWQFTAPTNPKAPSASTEWWKIYTKTGFASQLQVSMNSGRTFLPAQLQLGGRSLSKAAQVFGLTATGKLLSMFPNVGMVSGGTQVSVAGDFFHFDTQDTAVKLKWRDSSVVVPAICVRPEESTGVAEANSTTRRVVFRTPPLPFPDDIATAAAMAEGMILGTREEVEIFVSLDGEHFTDTSLSFVYCAVPEISGISPQEAEPGTKMALTVEKLMPTPTACVRLEAAESKISLVVPVEIDDAAHMAEFVLPELPISTEELVHVSLSLNGQEFTEAVTDHTVTPNGGEVSFRYKVKTT